MHAYRTSGRYLWLGSLFLGRKLENSFHTRPWDALESLLFYDGNVTTPMVRMPLKGDPAQKTLREAKFREDSSKRLMR